MFGNAQQTACPIALAHRAIRARPGTAEAAAIAEFYLPMTPADKLRFFGEVDACRKAKRRIALVRVEVG